MRVLLRSVLLIVFALLYSDIWAAKLFWVGGTGNFNDPVHWSFESGGRGGAKSPSVNDDVCFDAKSGKTKFIVDIIGGAICHSISATETAIPFVLNGTSNEKFVISGSVDIKSKIINQFEGSFAFKCVSNSTLNFGSFAFIGDVYFNGLGEWSLYSNLVTTNDATIYLQNGKLSAAGYSIFCGNIQSGNSSFVLNLTDVYLRSKGITSLNDNTVLIGSGVKFDYDLSNQTNSIGNAPSSYKEGNYSDQSLTASNIDSCSCNGVCDGAATISWTGTGGGGPFTIRWKAGATIQTFTAVASSPFNCTGLCANNGWTVQVFDQFGVPIPGAIQIVSVSEPANITLIPDFSSSATCFGTCDGKQSFSIIGGNHTYNVTVNPGPPTFYLLENKADTVKNLCMGWHTVSIIDRKGCSDLDSFFVAQPTVLSPNPGNTNQACAGVCNNKVWVAPSGGTPFSTVQTNGTFYHTVWDGNPLLKNDTLYNLCPSTHTCVVTDSNACPQTVIITINPATPITAVRNPASGALAINCLNNCNGSIGVTTVAGGTSPYTFTWLPVGGSQVDGATFSTYSSLCGTVAGKTYTCTITDANGCSITKTFTITAPPALTHVISHTNPKCVAGQGSSTGSATVTAGGGSPGFTFVWTPTVTVSGASPTSIGSNMNAGTYSVTITDSKGCLDSATVTLLPPVAVTGAITTTTNPTCPNLNNGQLCVTAGGGAPGYTYAWSPCTGVCTNSCTPSTLTVTPGGTSNYQVVITDINSCTLTVTGVMTSPIQATVTPAITNPPCGSAPCTGSATLNVAGGGGGGFTYAWSCSPTTLNNISGRCGGTSCNYTVTDAITNCKYTGTVSFAAAPPVLTATISATPLNCASDCNSTITSTVTGGTGIITYTWFPGPGNGTSINNVCAGNDTLRITDANGCTKTATVSIVSPPALTVTMVPTQPTCANTCNGSILVTVTGGTAPYPCTSWAPSIAPNSSTSLNPTGLCGSVAGISYSVNICDSKGCKDSNSVTLITPPSLTVSVNTGAITCSGLCNGTATATVGGGVGPYTYSWDANPFTAIDNTSALCAGPHSLDIKDANGCAGTTVIFNIVAPNPLSASVSNIVNTCGPCTGSASTFPSGGTPPYSYTWTPVGGTVTSTSVTSSYSNLCIGNYTLIVGDTNGCPTVSVPFSINAIIAINIAASSQSVSCNNGSDGVADATASGGTPNYNMVWTVSPGGAVVATCPSTPATCSAPGLPQGTYVITVTDAAGCINKDSIVIGNPPPLTVSGAQTNQKCFGSPCTGSATVTPVGGTPPYSIFWTDGPVGTPRSNMCPGTYDATFLDSKGCPGSQTFTITSSPQFTVASVINSPLACGGVTGSIDVTASGGTATYTVTWAAGGIASGVSPTFTYSNIGAGIYTLTVGDINGCDTVLQIGLSDPGTATVTATTSSVTCFGGSNGSATVTAVGPAPIVISWPGGIPPPGSSPIISSNDTAGTYLVQTVDSGGCVIITPVTIAAPPTITDGPVTIVQPNCGSGGSITFTEGGGDGGPYTFTWTPGSGGIGGNPRTNVPPGVDTVIIEDGSGCTKAFTFTMNPASSLTVTVAQTNNTCTYGCTGSASVTVLGGTPAYSYTWTSSAGNLPVGNTITNVSALCPGNYSVTVADNGGCSLTQTFTIVPAPAIIPNFTKKDNLCNAGCTGVASVAPTGGTGAPYTFLWSPGSGTVTSTASTSVDSSMCPANNYTVFITDGAGCIDTTTFTIVQPTLLTVQVDSTNPTCFGVCNGSATVTPSGGTGSTYTVSWAPNANICAGVTNCVATNLCAPPTVPQYTITTTDSNSCVNTHILVLVAPPKINANVTPTDPLCNNDCNGSLISNTTGGNAPFNYIWTPAGGIVSGVSPTSTYTNLCSGITYSLMITDASGCKDSSSYTLNNPVSITAVTTSNPASCGVADGSIVINSLTGNGTVTVLWLNPGTCTTSFTCSPLGFGTWSFEATDSKGCKDTFNVGVSNPNGPKVDSLQINDSCNSVCNGLIAVTVTLGVNGTIPYSFTWTPSGAGTVTTTTNSSTYSGLCPGTYISTVLDTAGCGTATTFVVTEPSSIQDNGNFTSATCAGINNATITSIASGGTGTTYTYTLDGITTNTTGIFVGVSAGPHNVCISDSFHCQKCFIYNIPASTVIVDTIIATPINCASNCNGVATLSNVSGGSGPYSMIWSDGQVGLIASNLCAGSYTVSISDTNGCQAIDSITITAPTPITVTTASVAPTCGSCNGTLSVIPIGGIPGVNPNYTYLWSPGGSTTFNIDSVCAGLHQVDITDSVGCKQTILIPVSDSLAPNVTVGATIPACNNVCNAILTTTVTGGVVPYTYQWSTSPTQTTPSISNGCPGVVYFVQVKDSVGCIATVSDTVKQGSILSANPTIINPDCDSTNGSIKLNVSGGSGSYSYSWVPVISVIDSIGPVGAGSYTAIVTDVVSGCIDTIPIALNSKNGPILTPFSTSPLCSGICLGTASVSIFGGAPTFTVSWSNGQSGLAIDSLCPSVNPYIVTVTDANGCVQTASAFVNDVSPLISSLPIITQPKCNGDCNGSITTIFTGGTPIYTYAWSPATVVGPGGSLLCANNYSVLVTDANGCTATEFDTLLNPALLTITGTVTPSSCNTTPDGAISTTTNGGTPSYTYQWSGGSVTTTPNLSAILAGNYTVMVTDLRNCKDSANFVVTPAINITVNAGNDTTLCSVPSFVLNGDTAGATSMQWIQLPNPPGTVVGTTLITTVTPTPGDTTQYVLTAQNGTCSNSDTITIISNTLPVPDAGLSSTVFLGQNTTIGGSPTNPGGGTIVWHPTTNISDTTAANPTATPSVTTTYTVYVTNPSGCMGWDTVTVTVLPTFVIPNGFSPNGDGYNETWQIDYIYMFPNCEVEVYNRWGEQLFYSKGYSTPWAGKYKGHDVPVGTYYYVIRLNDKKFPDHFTGPLTILR